MPGAEIVYGVVRNGVFMSSRMSRRLVRRVPDGICQMDAGADDFEATLEPADIQKAAESFRRASRIRVVRGVSFRDGMVPENPVRFPKLPVPVVGAAYGDLEEVEAVSVRDEPFFFLQTLSTQKAYPLMSLRERFESGRPADISDIKEVTPEMRVAYAFLMLERQKAEAERLAAERARPVNAITDVMTRLGAEVRSVKESTLGYEVVWKFGRHTLSTVLDRNFRVVEAGYCVSGRDRTQSVRSVVNVLKDYVRDGDAVHIMRAPGEPGRQHWDDEDDD